MDIKVHSRYEDGDFIYNHITKKNQSKDEYVPHFHDIYELIFVKSGEVSYIVDGRKYALNKNSLVITRPGDVHCIVVENGESDYERYNILFDEKILSHPILERMPKSTHVMDFNASGTVTSIFSKMEYYCKNLSGSDLKHILKSLTEEVILNILIELSPTSAQNYTELDSTMQRAVRYIDENLLAISGIEDICNNIYVTKSHLHHLFTKYLKITPKRYIMAKRLAIARREIYMGAKVTEVFARCGFSDYSAFFRAYKNHFGVAPSRIDEKDSLSTVNGDLRHRYNT